VIQYTRYAACHLAPLGIRVNAVSPGPFPDGPDGGEDADRFRERLAAQVPLGRTGAAAEIVGPVAFLLSDAASYVTGHVLWTDGGYSGGVITGLIPSL
jgi:NAD(P)-dependent dehydrogenase (short-subunit alcohol dehydrogenase family)